MMIIRYFCEIVIFVEYWDVLQQTNNKNKPLHTEIL